MVLASANCQEIKDNFRFLNLYMVIVQDIVETTSWRLASIG
jgi:hypothetical protein